LRSFEIFLIQIESPRVQILHFSLVQNSIPQEVLTSDDLSGLEQAAMATAAGVGVAGGAAVALPLIGGLMAIPIVGPFLAFGALVGSHYWSRRSYQPIKRQLGWQTRNRMLPGFAHGLIAHHKHRPAPLAPACCH